ncbi:MAG TPA: hypothetical protein VGH99_17930 [Pseudonocardia sp.]|jgi:hypothetical protein
MTRTRRILAGTAIAVLGVLGTAGVAHASDGFGGQGASHDCDYPNDRQVEDSRNTKNYPHFGANDAADPLIGPHDAHGHSCENGDEYPVF